VSAQIELYEQLAAYAGVIELRVEHYIHHDGFPPIHDYAGPQLIVIAHAGKLVTIHELGRHVEDLDLGRMMELIELGLAACDERQADGGIDTAIARPMTSYHLRVYRALREADRSASHSINHYAARALGPAYSALLAALRETSGAVHPSAARAWDRAATWMCAQPLGDMFDLGQPVPLPRLVNAFACNETVYFRAGQAPDPSELYRLDGNQLSWLRGNDPPIPLTMLDHLRYELPCGGGVIELHQEWEQPRRIYVRNVDPARGIWVQR
jgi:hypothetical protein